MSTIVRAFLLRELMDAECIEESLKEINHAYTKSKNKIILDQNLAIEMTPSGARLNYIIQEGWNNVEINSFIEKLTKAYTKKLNEKIERLKLEEAKMREVEALKQFAEDERKQRELEFRTERMKLEAIKRKEEVALKKQIEEKTTALKQKALQLGYQVKEEIKGKERILVLLRS